MANVSTGKYGKLLLCLIFVGCGTPSPMLHASDLAEITNNWQYRLSGRQQDDNQQSFRQRYGVTFAPQITQALYLNGDVSYTKNWIERGGMNESLTPTMTVGVKNDIFSFDLSGTATETTNSESSNMSTRSWEATWTSNWSRPWWPSLRLIYGQDLAKDDEQPHLTDTDQTHTGLDFDLDLKLAQLFYRINYETTEDNVNLSEDTNTDQFARLEASRTFWDDRLNVGVSQQVTQNSQEFTAQPTGTGFIERRVTISQTLAGLDDKPADDSLPVSAALADSDLETVVLTINPNDDMNIGVRVNGQQVDKLYIYTDPDPVSPLTPAELATYRWDLYSSTDGDTWTRERAGITATFNATEDRFEIDVGGLEKFYLKVVVTDWPTLASLGVTEVEAIRQLSTSSGAVSETERYTNYLTDVNLGVEISETLNASSTVSFEQGDYSSGNNFDRSALTGNLKWSPNSYVTPTFGFSDTRYQSSDSPKSMNRSYSITVPVFPLPTLDLSLGVTKTDSYTDDVKTSSTNNYTLLTTAALYPDLNTSFDVTYTTTKNEETGTSTSNIDSRLNVTARISSKLTADLETNYEQFDGETDTENYDTLLNLNYRPSDLLSLRLTAGQDWGDDDEPHTLGLSANVALLRTSKTQLTFIYTYTETTHMTENYSVNWSWDISRYLTLQTNSNYTNAETDQWNITSLLSLKF